MRALTLRLLPTKGFTMTLDHEQSSQERIPSPDEHDVPELEFDQSEAPRPEEEIADVLRAEPDVPKSAEKSE